MVVGTLALTGVGIPFTSIGFAGFVSKDAIIEAAYASQRPGAVYAFLCVVIAAGFTSFYSWRLVFMTFFGKFRGEAGHEEAVHDAHAHDLPADPVHGHAHDEPVSHDHGHGDHTPHESPSVMLIPLVVLALGATLAGLAFRYFFIGGGFEGFWHGAIYLASSNHILEEIENVPALVSLSPTLMMIGGFLIAYYMYIVAPDTPRQLAQQQRVLYNFLLNKWYFDEIYDFLFVKPAFWLGRLLWKGGDGRIIDGLGPDGVAARVIDVTRGAVKLQTGFVYNYAFAMLIGVAAFITWFLFGGMR
jgi:NADH-quinone oxidoreductase subunit L